MAKDKAARDQAKRELTRAKREHARVYAADRKAKAETRRFLRANDRLHKARGSAKAAGVRGWWF